VRRDPLNQNRQLLNGDEMREHKYVLLLCIWAFGCAQIAGFQDFSADEETGGQTNLTGGQSSTGGSSSVLTTQIVVAEGGMVAAGGRATGGNRFALGGAGGFVSPTGGRSTGGRATTGVAGR
jgi:hypothetical protein